MSARLANLTRLMWAAAGAAQVHREHGNVAGFTAARREVERLRVEVMVAETQVFKRCACGAADDRKAWDALPLVGEQEGEPTLTLKNCQCGSTLAARSREEAA